MGLLRCRWPGRRNSGALATRIDAVQHVVSVLGNIPEELQTAPLSRDARPLFFILTFVGNLSRAALVPEIGARLFELLNHAPRPLQVTGMHRRDVDVAVSGLNVHVRKITHPEICCRPVSQSPFEYVEVTPFSAFSEPQVPVKLHQIVENKAVTRFELQMTGHRDVRPHPTSSPRPARRASPPTAGAAPSGAAS